MAHASKPPLHQRTCTDCKQTHWVYACEVHLKRCITCEIRAQLKRATTRAQDLDAGSSAARTSRIRQADQRD